jgi:hypothetical protein
MHHTNALAVEYDLLVMSHKLLTSAHCFGAAIAGGKFSVNAKTASNDGDISGTGAITGSLPRLLPPP